MKNMDISFCEQFEYQKEVFLYLLKNCCFRETAEKLELLLFIADLWCTYNAEERISEEEFFWCNGRPSCLLSDMAIADLIYTEKVKTEDNCLLAVNGDEYGFCLLSDKKKNILKNISETWKDVSSDRIMDILKQSKLTACPDSCPSIPFELIIQDDATAEKLGFME